MIRANEAEDASAIQAHISEGDNEDAADPDQEHDQRESGSEDEQSHDDSEGDNNGDDGSDSAEQADPIPSVLSINDPRRMQLTREELEWARDVKELTRGYPDLDNVSDFMCAQIAIITRGDLDDAVSRVVALQYYRQNYKVIDTEDDGIRYLNFLVPFFPTQILSFCFSISEGTYLLVQDVTKMETCALSAADKVNDWMAASYYMHNAMCPDFATIRRGTITLLECEGMRIDQKQDFKLIQKLLSELLCYYPFKGEMRCFHTGVAFNIMAAIMRRLVPEGKIMTGCTFEGRLDQFYLLPDVTTANRRVLEQLIRALKRRYENEKSFSLLNPGIVGSTGS
ncbi:expressed unknown protein [Seminavis robusta]|uniref:Uncharacterized protein n=1 Tax=Seminavis robusta TaxID=568900 RepID=A0A9N8E8D1_9STRA|nr:expressed unknown protein [Seminavis robusta]|eukprot:Sro796_g203660.1 n/a (339) ;mRNA; f:7131-8147